MPPMLHTSTSQDNFGMHSSIKPKPSVICTSSVPTVTKINHINCQTNSNKVNDKTTSHPVSFIHNNNGNNAYKKEILHCGSSSNKITNTVSQHHTALSNINIKLPPLFINKTNTGVSHCPELTSATGSSRVDSLHVNFYGQ